jgi:uncharacterized membrane protein
MEASQPDSDRSPAGLSPVLEHNIHVLLRRRIRDERSRPAHEKFFDRLAAYVGSVWAIVFHGVVYGTWLFLNLPGTPWPHFDASLLGLGVCASIESIFLFSMVLIRQNRMGDQSDRRNDLNLQISLLTEHELTRLIALVGHIASHLKIDLPADAEFDDLMRDIGPEKVLDRLHEEERKAEKAEEQSAL